MKDRDLASFVCTSCATKSWRHEAAARYGRAGTRQALTRLGYLVTRQTGSHIRLTCPTPPTHSVTVPDHSPLKIGTLHAILSDIALHHRIDKAALVQQLFD
jgi:predicted RNA binding protein YcfA (HicA-like mRNA interferase family)